MKTMQIQGPPQLTQKKRKKIIEFIHKILVDKDLNEKEYRPAIEKYQH